MNCNRSFVLNFAPAVLLILSSCGIHENKASAVSINASTATKVSYAQVNANVFQVSCKTCHMNGQAHGGIALDTYAEVFANLGAVKAAVFDGVPNIMPSGGLPTDQKQLLLTWINQGAVETPTADPVPTATPSGFPVATVTPLPTATPMPTATPVQSPLIPTYPSIRDNVFAAKCLMCHATGQRAADKPLDTYAAMMAVNGFVVPGNAEGSAIVNAIERGSMPPKKANLPAVTAEELAIIQFWITTGALDGTPPFTPSTSPTPVPVPVANGISR